MIFQIEAKDPTGSIATIRTEDPREALQSFLAFEAAKFLPVYAYDEEGRVLLESDLLELAGQTDRLVGHKPIPTSSE